MSICRRELGEGGQPSTPSPDNSNPDFMYECALYARFYCLLFGYFIRIDICNCIIFVILQQFCTQENFTGWVTQVEKQRGCVAGGKVSIVMFTIHTRFIIMIIIMSVLAACDALILVAMWWIAEIMATVYQCQISVPFLWVGWTWRVNGHTTWCTSLLSVVLQL